MACSLFAISFKLVSCMSDSLSLKWMQRIPPHHLLTFNRLHRVISHKEELLTTIVRTSNPTISNSFFIWALLASELVPSSHWDCAHFIHVRTLIIARLLGICQILCTMILLTLMMEAICSSETSVLTRATWHHIPEDGILHSDHCKYLRSYIALTGWAL
jgi:hypothetical protein